MARQSSHWVAAIEQLANAKVVFILMLILWVLAPGYLVIFYFAPDMFIQFDAIKITVLAATFACMVTTPLGCVTFLHIWDNRAKYTLLDRNAVSYAAIVISTSAVLVMTAGNVFLQYFTGVRSFKSLLAGIVFGEIVAVIYLKVKDR